MKILLENILTIQIKEKHDTISFSLQFRDCLQTKLS
jgi:hypothetical protein